jgi:hypothetical protein
MVNRSALRAIVVSVAIVALLAVPSAWAGGSPSSAASNAPALASPTVAASPPAAISPAGPHPAFTCPQTPPFPVWQPVGSISSAYPILPDPIEQVPCAKLAIDEVHASLSSPTAGSGERWTIPVHLPVDGSQTYQAQSYPQFYIGMVTKGSAISEWRQTYSAVTFQPVGPYDSAVTSYAESVHIFALENASHEGGACNAYTEVTIVWNVSLFCVRDDVQSSNISGTSAAPGDWLNVTFAGNQSQATGLDIWVNDSTTPADTLATVLNSTNTGDGTFEPFYNAACTDTCMLQWSVKSGTGLGFGFTMCPFTGGASYCDSYNDTRFNETNPVQFGIPHFWTGSAYDGDYRYFAPQSTSGVCNSNALPGTLANCYSENTFSGNGFYPAFSYNGTVLDFGVARSYTTQDWGGAIFELLSTGAPNDLTPFYFGSITNNSRAGFVAPSSTITVSTNLQDLGNVRSAGVTYRVNSGAAVSIPMSLVSGNFHDGVWNATIPSGPNGWVNYTVNATNNASATLLAPPGSSSFHIQRGPLPTFSVKIVSSLYWCGGVEINGTLYHNGSVALLEPGAYPILGVGCYPWVFKDWTLSKGITISPTGSINGIVSISANGTIDLSWIYVRPLDTITLFTTPTLCGQIILNGQQYAPTGSGIAVQVYNDTNYSLGESGCGGFSFSGWTVGGNFTILGNNILLAGNGSLTATFVSSASSFTIIFATNPSSCGGILFKGAGYSEGQTLAEDAGTYAIAPDPCYHWGFASWSTSGSTLSVSGGQLTVSGSGTLTENNYVLTIVTIVTSPSYCGSVTFDGASYRNGAAIVVANNSTHSVFATACASTYLFSITGTGGVVATGNLATVNASGELIATFLPGSPTNFVGFLTDPPTCGAIYLSGNRYTSSNYTYVATGSQATVTAQPCSNYGFLEWITFGGITILNSTAYINGPGAIEAIFRPIAEVFLYTSPPGCGTINIQNVSYPSNTTLELTEDKAYPLSASPCVGLAFAQWVNSSGALISGGVLTLTTGAVLTAIFLPVRYAVTILADPPTCGGVRVAGQDYSNGTVLTLARSTFSIYPVPCAGDHLVAWKLSSALTITNTTLWVNGSGNLTALYQPVPPSVTLSVATSSYAGIALPFSAVVAVPVPPYTYNFTWNFGDGPSVTTPVNFTAHTYQQAGHYAVTVTVTDPYNRTANATVTIQVIAQSAAQVTGLTTVSIAALGLAVVAVVVVVVVGSRLRRPPPETSPSLLPPTDAGSSRGPTGPADDPTMEPPKP